MHVPRTLTRTVAGLMAMQAALGLIASAQYRDVDWIRATWFGNDWLTLVIAVPLLLISSHAAQRGSARGYLLWAGAVGYALYNYAFYLLGAALNVFFPLYAVLVVLATVTLIVALGRFDPASIAVDGRRGRISGGALVIVGGALAVVWTTMWAAYVFAGRATPVEPEVFRLVAALDLSLMVPALVSGGVLLWRRRPWGLVIAAIAGVQGSLYLAVLSLNSLIAIQRRFAEWPGEFVIWAPATVVMATVTLLLLVDVRPGMRRAGEVGDRG